LLRPSRDACFAAAGEEAADYAISVTRSNSSERSNKMFARRE